MTAVQLIKPYFAENRRLILIGFLCLILVDILQLFVPRIIKRVVDDLTAFQIDIDGLVVYAATVIGIGIAIGFFRYLWRRCLLGTSRRVEEGLRNQLFTHIETLSATYFDQTQTGDLMARATNDIRQVRMATGMGMVALNDAIVLGAAAIGFMAYINVRLTLFVLIPMPFIVLGTRFFGKQMHRRYQDVQASFADLTEGVRERLTGIRIVKAYGTEATEQQQIKQLSETYIQHNLKLVTITGSFFPLMLLFSNTSLAIVLYLGGRQTILQEITAGEFVAFISYLGLLTWPMMAMGWVTNLIQRGRASLDRIHVVLQTQPEIRDTHDAVSIQKTYGQLCFEQVGLSFDRTGPAALANIQMDLEPGETVGIIGPPGSGKTTLLNLVLRFYDVTQGRILMDGMDIRSIRLDHLRAQIAYVPQEPFMFAGTILENLTLGDRTYSREKIEQAARMASIFTTIQSFPHGFETLVGERGVILSGGQKQRIALARALLANRPLLLLDDPISQVDTDTGNRIIDTIRSLAGQKTILIVSHRISAIQFADRMMSINKGQIVEYGTHAELMANNQYYARTFRLQDIRHAT
jgi:ATP-binding cassette, subfamily B, multidrug efflux pump